MKCCYCRAEVYLHALELPSPCIPSLSLGSPQLLDEDGDEDGPGVACEVAPYPHLITALWDQRYHSSAKN